MQICINTPTEMSACSTLFVPSLQLYSQTCGAFLSILRKQCQRSDATETAGMHEVMDHMIVLLQRRLVAVQWEVRDTTLEFVRNVIGIMPGASGCE